MCRTPDCSKRSLLVWLSCSQSPHHMVGTCGQMDQEGQCRALCLGCRPLLRWETPGLGRLMAQAHPGHLPRNRGSQGPRRDSESAVTDMPKYLQGKSLHTYPGASFLK